MNLRYVIASPALYMSPGVLSHWIFWNKLNRCVLYVLKVDEGGCILYANEDGAVFLVISETR